MQVRSARIEDISAIQELNYQLFVHDDVYHHDLNMTWSQGSEGEAYFRRCIEQSEVCLSVVAESDGNIVGYLNGSIREPDGIYLGKRAELENMCVTAHSRGHGVGSKLVDAFKNWAQAQGAERMIVEAFDGNEDALRFYEKQGFSGYSVTLSRVMNEMEGPMRCSEEWKKGTSI